MRIISGILAFVLFGFLGAFFAGPVGDWLISLPTFESPDQQADFDFIARIGVTVATGLVGAIIGIVLAGLLRGQVIRRDH
jgi:hypothetical protein